MSVSVGVMVEGRERKREAASRPERGIERAAREGRESASQVFYEVAVAKGGKKLFRPSRERQKQKKKLDSNAAEVEVEV